MVEEVIRRGKGREENNLTIHTGFDHSFFFPLLKLAFILPKTQFKIVFGKGVK